MRVKRGREWSDNFPARDPFRFPPPDGLDEYRTQRKRDKTRDRVRRFRERQASQAVLREMSQAA